MMNVCARVAICLLSLSFAMAAISQESFNVPKKKAMTVRTETVLSAIKLYNTKVDEVMKTFGQPTTRTEHTGYSKLEWERNDCLLTLVVDEESIKVIEVRGSSSNCEFGLTGRGLRLGASVSEVLRVYPARYTPGFILPGRSADCPAHPTLELEFSDSGLLTHMILSDGTICY